MTLTLGGYGDLMRRRFRKWVPVMAVGALLVTLMPAIAGADHNESTAPADNPDLTKACGLDVLMILDESGSIDSSHATQDVRNAFSAFVSSLNNTGSSMSVIEFSTVARLPSIGGTPPGTYVTIDDATSQDFNSYINNQYNPNDRTNWEDALRVARYMAPRPDPLVPHLVVFITDGDPTAVVDNHDVTSTEYQTKVPLSENETTSASGSSGVNPAIPNANFLKSEGSHILAIGVGSALQNNDSRQRLEKVSGTDVYDGTGTFDISTDDLYLEENFANLEDALRNAAFQLCAPSVNVRKLYDPTPDPDSLDDAIPGVGWEMTGTVLSVPAPDSFDWVLPNSATGAATAPDSATDVTDGAGFVTFQWTPTNPNGNSQFTLTEDSVNNPPDPPGGGYVNDPDQTTCTYRTPDTSDLPFAAGDITVDPDGGFTLDILPQSIVTCTLVNLATPAPGIDIEKATNGADADTGVGPIISLGDPVTWTYVVRNTGNTTLVDLDVEDSVIGTIDCPDTIAIDDAVTCTATGTAEAGQYENTATATAVDTNGIAVDDDDPSHYFGAASGIVVEKATNGQDADSGFGPGIAVGDPVTWTYSVMLSDDATIPVDNVVLTDDAGTPVPTGDDFTPAFGGGDGGVIGQLEVGETWTYTASGTATAGQYENFATVTGDPIDASATVTDNDPSHYYGIVSALSIEKYTNGADADVAGGPDVPVIRTGGAVAWTYVVTNEGNAPVPSWTVNDDVLGPVSCTRQFLLVGASAVCHANGTATEGEYENNATVTGTDIIGNPIPPDSDPSHYVGVTPALTIEKATNTEDADAPTGPFIPIGDLVTWDYVVENTGSATLTNLVVIDPIVNGLTPLTCADTTLDPSDTTTCQATSTAAEGQYFNFAIAVARDPFGKLVGDLDPSHYFGAASGIDLEKYTNGVDADEPLGALIPVGDPVEWSYVVTNTGNVTINDISLVDDQLGAVTCPVTTLDSGESTTCTATGTAVRGQYENSATVTGQPTAGAEVSDTDPSHYFGYLLQIGIEKATNGEDADVATGPYVPVGDPVTWTYVVTNPGDYFFSDVIVTDDQGVVPVFQGGDTDADTFLDPGEVWTYQATGTAEEGQYENSATVEGTVGEEFDNVLTDTDPSHYFGLIASIDIDKTPDNYVVALGDPHTFDIAVTNTSNVDLTDVEVTDPVTPDCDRSLGTMTPGQVITYSCVVARVLQPVLNTAFAAGNAPDGSVVTDQDDAAVTVVGAGGTAAIGDLVWQDTNRNQIQDAGEVGIPNARVRLEVDPESVSGISLAAPVGIDLVTDSTGHYMATGLIAGDYVVSLDPTSVVGDLTTPVSYAITLNTGDVRLDADFGLAGALPFTGASNFDWLFLIGSVLLLVGGAIVLQVRENRYLRSRG
jgi:uncharacterized repeat protein (TIGR01451 family)